MTPRKQVHLEAAAERHICVTWEDESLAAVLSRLGEEHELIAEVLDRFDRALVALVSDRSGAEETRRLADELSDALLFHLAYEENQLPGPLGRSSIVV